MSLSPAVQPAFPHLLKAVQAAFGAKGLSDKKRPAPVGSATESGRF